MGMKREFFSKKISSYAGDVKGSRKIITQVLNKKSKTIYVSCPSVEDETILGNKAIAESMNNFFCDIGKRLMPRSHCSGSVQKRIKKYPFL